MKTQLIILITLTLASCGLPDFNAISNLDVKAEPMIAFKLEELDYNLEELIALKDYTVDLPSVKYSRPKTISEVSEEREVQKIVKSIDFSKPENEILDSKNLHTKNLQIIETKIEKGIIKLSITYSSDVPLKVKFNSEEIKDSDRNNLEFIINLPKQKGSKITVSKELDLSNYTIEPDNNVVNLTRVIIAKIEKGDIYRSSELESFDFDVIGIKAKYIKLRFDSHPIELESQKLKLKAFELPDNLKLGESGHKLIFDITNPFAAPINVIFSKLAITRLNKKVNKINFTSDIGENRIRLAPAELKKDNTIIPKITSFTLSNENSNIKEFIALDISSLESKIIVEVNPESNRDIHTITKNTNTKIVLKVDLPVVISSNMINE